MIIWMILQKRKEAAIAFSQGLPESSLRYRLAQKWHHFAVFAVLLLLAAGIGSMILGTASGQGMLTLLMVPLYFMLNYILRLMLEAAFGIVDQPQEQPVLAAATSDGAENEVETEAAPSPAGEASMDKSTSGGRLDLDRMKGPLRTALRLALAVLLFFWTLDIWNVHLPIGEAVVRTLIEILAVVLICYVAWGLINAAIQRRMRREIPEDTSEEMEEGGAGGSRIGTLLMLLRKFMLVVIVVMASLIVLSSLGVHIGPLIAGAPVFWAWRSALAPRLWSKTLSRAFSFSWTMLSGSATTWSVPAQREQWSTFRCAPLGYATRGGWSISSHSGISNW
jgi:hypothetical protein